MLESLLTDRQRALREEVRKFVKSVPKQLLLDMDADKVRYPREYVVSLATSKLLGLRFNPAYGGRGLKWVDEIIALEEIGVLGMSLGCLFSLVSIVGEALDVFGSDQQKKKYLEPLLKGKDFLCRSFNRTAGRFRFLWRNHDRGTGR